VSDKYSIEHVERMFDDVTGEYFEVGPDSDGLDLIAIRWGDDPAHPDGECPGMNGTQARLLGEMLMRAGDRAARADDGGGRV